ncbi:glycosyltransferase family 4 protein [Mariluticola halotolerans]|uniref:glycosyltransferase family 4 protein n=1 Tax=Mariluticola halotolerans TaxID=2909283 RepID=UPI0026E479A5|nr:glycosyltransferase family 1 protein [Mariluticola halotolerans]UJQ95452.1 glycosyltransferase family 1 protein [Mariluticola halotolerans]
MDKVLIVTDAWKPQTNGVVRCLEAVSSELRSRGFKVVFLSPDKFWTLPMPTYPEIQLALAPIGAVGDFINRHRPDHIHIATEGPLGFQARMHCEGEQLAFTTSYHTRFPEYLAARIPVPAEMPTEVSYAYLRWFHSGASTTLVPTRSVASELQQKGFDNLTVWSRGVDKALFSPGPKTRFTNLPGPHLLYVGRVAVEKNVAAFLQLKTPGSKIVVGDGPQLEELKQRFPDAHFLGRKTGAELTELYRSADVFVFPSKTDTFGNVMIEAMSCGVPVAAYPVTGPIDVLTDPACGAMDEDLHIATAKALALSRDAASAHAARFTWAHCTDQFQTALVPALARHHHAA